MESASVDWKDGCGDRWRIVSRQWEENKSAANKMDLLEQLDYYGKLTAQLDWQRNPGKRPVRVLYSGWGAPTAALLHDDDAIVDYKLFWVACRDAQEAHYLLAIVNSDALFEMVTPLMSKGQFGARDLQKHLWKLPIPEFNPHDPLHIEVSDAGRVATVGAAQQLERLRQERTGLPFRSSSGDKEMVAGIEGWQDGGESGNGSAG